jgi:hypothetical protein
LSTDSVENPNLSKKFMGEQSGTAGFTEPGPALLSGCYMQIPKEKPYRNPELLKLASEAPYCMYCKEPNHGQVVSCHMNSLKHGKGTGVKAHDIPCYLCKKCHDMADGRVAPHLNKTERDLILYEGVYNTFLWFLRRVSDE